MEEHRILKNICDKIGYEPKYNFNKKYNIFQNNVSVNGYYRTIDIREIIFTPGFMEKYLVATIKKEEHFTLSFISEGILLHLRNPVQYLANLLDIK